MARSKPSIRLLGAQDTFYIGTLKGVGRIYQQSSLNLSRMAHAKLYDRKNALVAAELLDECCRGSRNRMCPCCEC